MNLFRGRRPGSRRRWFLCSEGSLEIVPPNVLIKIFDRYAVNEHHFRSSCFLSGGAETQLFILGSGIILQEG